jgi:hypothetical protein
MYQLHTPPVAPFRFGRGFGIVARDTERLRVGFDIETAGPERDDVVAYGGDLDVTPGAERLPPGQLVAPLLQPATGRAQGARAPMFGAARPATRGARARRGHRHYRTDRSSVPQASPARSRICL